MRRFKRVLLLWSQGNFDRLGLMNKSIIALSQIGDIALSYLSLGVRLNRGSGNKYQTDDRSQDYDRRDGPGQSSIAKRPAREI